MNSPTEVIIESTDKSVAVAQPLEVFDPLVESYHVIREMAQKGITADNAAAMREMMGMCERMEDRKAERDFNSAFVQLQRELPVIVAKTEIPNRGKYERFEDVMDAIARPLINNGFSVSFDQEPKDGRITVTCILRHISGHSHKNSFTVRLGGKADSETQADCKASTTAKRNSLLAALNIVIRQDCLQDESDYRNEGANITPVQAKQLFDRVLACKADVVRFLGVAKITLPANASGEETQKAFESIPSASFAEMDRLLKIKEKK